MVYRKANGEIGSLDYREKAPLAATKDMFRLKRKCNKGKVKSPWLVFPDHCRRFAVHENCSLLSKILKTPLNTKKGVIVTKKTRR
jgi:gamma-glutamyltranspeptidase/glutathione hydrolase